MITDFSPLLISIKISFFATLFAFLIGTYLAYLIFFYQGKGKKIIDALLTLPIVLPPTVLGFLLLLIFNRNTVSGKILSELGIAIVFHWWGGVITGTLVAFPLVYKIVFGAFKQVEIDLINTAQTLGANQSQILFQILFPLTFPSLLAGIVLSFARVLGEFGATFMLIGNIPRQTQTMAMAIFLEASAGNMDRALIWVMIMVLITLGILILINYYSSSSISAVNKWGKWVGNWLINHHTYQPPIEEERNKKLVFHIDKKLAKFSLNIEGEIKQQKVGFLGASGTGKSITLKCLAGILTPDRGKIILNGKTLFDAPQKINIPTYQRKIGIVPQNYALFPHLTVTENIAFGLQDIPFLDRSKRIEYYLNLVELFSFQDYYPHQLSGGQKQRVALARALATQPSVLLLDEPLSALDTYLRSHLEHLLIKILASYDGITIFVTHKLEEAYRLCDRLMVLSEGKIVADDRKEAIFSHPPNYITAKVTECKNFSAVKIIDSQTIEALDWNCTLKAIEPITPSIQYVAFRAHHFRFVENEHQENTFPCWLSKISETQHRVTLFLSINSPANNSENYHLQAEVYREKWEQLQQRSFPWYIYLNPVKLILLSQ
jgi:molybdate transport system permease protein